MTGQYRIKDAPYNDPDIVNRRNERIEQLCSILFPIMNKIHNVNYSERFWLIVLSDHLKTCLNREPLMSKSDYKEPALFVSVNSRQIPVRKAVLKNWLVYLGRKFKKGTSLDVFQEKVKSNANICIGTRSHEHERNGVGVATSEYFPWLMPVHNAGLRKRAVNHTNGRYDMFIRNIIANLPTFFLEHFAKNLESIPTVNNPGEKIFHYEHLQSPFSYLTLAKYQEYGAKIFFYQTGGYIGEVSFSPSKLFYRTIDKFITYGWKVNEKDQPGKAYRMDQYFRSWKKQLDLGVQQSIDCLIVFSLIDEYTKEYYYNTYRYLISNLDRKKYGNVVLRPRLTTTRLVSSPNEFAFLKVEKDSVSIDDGKGPLAILAAKSKVIVHLQLPSTNFLEAVYCMQPVLGVNTNYSPSQAVASYYEDLTNLKVIHPNIQSLVNHLNAVQINEWWDRVLRDDRFTEFGNNFVSFRFKNFNN